MVNENCLEYQILINEKLDNEIKENDEKKLSSHLNNCDECSHYFSDLKSIKSSFSEIEKISVSADFNDKLLKRIQSSEKKSFKINENEKLIEENRKIKSTPIFTKFVSYAAGIAIVAFAFVALEKSNLIEKDGTLNSSNSIDNSKIMATIIDSSESNKFASKNIEESTLDSLEKLKNKPYIDINDMKHRVSNEGK